MMHQKSEASKAAREAFDAMIAACARGEVSQEAVTWVGSKAFAEFRADAMAWAAGDMKSKKITER